MSHWSTLAPTVLAAFMASLVEFVEALTIILAVGIVRGWRSPLLGAASALLFLVALVAVLGRSLAEIPLPWVQLVVGTLLLMFGMRWLRKAVLRSAGVLALHDEKEAFVAETAALRRQSVSTSKAIDPVAFATAFKTVLLEGIEVVFIVVAIGAGGALIGPASVGAGLALLVVVALGLVLHRPLAALPENKLKFGVGVLLSAFGTFWVGEGIGLLWPAADWTILGLAAIIAAVAVLLVPTCARWRASVRARKTVSQGPAVGAIVKPPGRLAAALAQGWKLFVDDGWLALGILAWVAIALLTRQSELTNMAFQRIAFPAGLVAMLIASVLRRATR